MTYAALRHDRPRTDRPIRPNSVPTDLRSHAGATTPEGCGRSRRRGEQPFTGSNFQAALKDLESRMREAASNLEFEEAARLRDEIKRMKLMDLEFANEVLTAEGEAVDTAAPKRWRAEANAEKAERFRKGR